MTQTQKVARKIQAIRPYHEDCQKGISKAKMRILSYDSQEDIIHLDYAIKLLGSQVIQNQNFGWMYVNVDMCKIHVIVSINVMFKIIVPRLLAYNAKIMIANIL